MLRIWLLGPLRLEVDGVQAPPPSSRRAGLLLAMLALERRPHSREALAARLWPDVLDESARVSLRTALVRLRSAIGPESDRFLDASRDRVALAGPDRVWTDVGELDHRLQAGEVEAALELCGEELRPGWRTTGSTSAATRWGGGCPVRSVDGRPSSRRPVTYRRRAG